MGPSKGLRVRDFMCRVEVLVAVDVFADLESFNEYGGPCGVGQGGSQGKGWAMPRLLLPAL